MKCEIVESADNAKSRKIAYPAMFRHKQLGHIWLKNAYNEVACIYCPFGGVGFVVTQMEPGSLENDRDFELITEPITIRFTP